MCTQDLFGYSCNCLDGYTLGSDGKQCHYTESKFDSVFTCISINIFCFLYLCIVPELLVSSSRLAISTINGRVFVTEIDGTELERNVDVDHTNLNIDTGLIYAVEHNLENGKIYFSDRNTSTLWTASLDDEIRASDDRQVNYIYVESGLCISLFQLISTESIYAWAFAYDWISHSLYWSDDRYIVICYNCRKN